jgi:hypothetical protein
MYRISHIRAHFAKFVQSTRNNTGKFAISDVSRGRIEEILYAPKRDTQPSLVNAKCRLPYPELAYKSYGDAGRPLLLSRPNAPLRCRALAPPAGGQGFGRWTVPLTWFFNHVKQMMTVVDIAQQ